MKPAWSKVLPPLALLATLSVGLLLTDLAPFRHSFVFNRADCAILQIRQLPDNTRFVALGSSRVRRGIDVSLLESDLTPPGARAFNFGRPGRNVARSYVMLRDILQTGAQVRNVYVEVDLDALAGLDNDERLPVARDAAFLTWREQWVPLASMPSRPWMERLHLGARSTLAKLQASIVNLMTGRFARLWNEAEGEAPNICWNPRFDRQTVATQARKDRSRRFYENRHGDLDSAWEPEFHAGTGWQADRELYYLDRIRTLTAQHHIRLVVSRHWAAFQPPLSPESIDRIRTLIPEFAYPDARHVRSSWTGFLDQAHMDVAARRSFTLWLQSQFR